MAKKKKKSKGAAAKPMSPEQYIREKARLLLIGKCYVTQGWQQYGTCSVIVTRLHPTGTLTVGLYLVDTFCRGVYDAFCRFSIDEYEFEDIMNHFSASKEGLEEVEYPVAHNIIYGAVEFAAEAGIKPTPGFSLARYILEEDTDDVPLIEYDFGRDGKHWLMVHSELEASSYLPAMKRTLGDNFEVTIMPDEDDDDFDEYDDEEVDDSFFGHLDDNFAKSEYAYEHPEYPSSIELKHQWVQDLFTNPDNELLSKEDVDRVLALPHDELRHDLEQMALFEMGRNVRGEYFEPYNPVISHILLFLGEVGDEGSLDVVLEIMRQDEDFREYHICDAASMVLNPPLYQLAKHNLRRLLEYLEEPGLETYFRVEALNVLISSAEYYELERREEIIGYAHEFAEFLLAHKDDRKIMDGTVAAFLCDNLLEIQAKELMPDIEALYATGYLDTGVCGKIESVRKEMQHARRMEEPVPFDISRIYERMCRTFGKK